jgi:hypothetical protein
LYAKDQRRSASCLIRGAFRLWSLVLLFSYSSNTLFKLEKQAARRGAINTPTSLTRTMKSRIQMIQAKTRDSTPRPTAPESSPEQALHEQLHPAGMRLQHLDRNHYSIIWRHQTVASGLTLLGAARFIDRALNREARS